jgi:hypothetical protein
MLVYIILINTNINKSSVHRIFMFIRVNKRKKKIYYYIVESERDGKKVKQKTLLYLGSAETVYNKLKKKNKNNL